MAWFWIVVSLIFSCSSYAQSRQGERHRSRIQHRLLDESDQILSRGEVSYVYGGYSVGDSQQCGECQKCLKDKKPSPKTRMSQCAVCKKCSLDCSHFIQLVYRNAGIHFPYLTTRTMSESSVTELKKFGFIDLGKNIQHAQTGDLFVYHGHVVMLERLTGYERGDIIHATGGRDIRGPGEGVQRERSVPLSVYGGPLLRVLRHRELL